MGQSGGHDQFSGAGRNGFFQLLRELGPWKWSILSESGFWNLRSGGLKNAWYEVPKPREEIEFSNS